MCSLYEVFTQLPDPRSSLGRRHPLSAILNQATFHNVFKAFDAEAFERALSQWLRGRWRAGWRRIAIDGKTLRGAQGDQLPGVHLLAAFA